MSLSCDHLVGDLGHVGTFAGEVTRGGRGLSVAGELVTLTNGQRVRIVEHVLLCKSGFAAVHVLNRDVRLGNPLPLDVNALLAVSRFVKGLSHQVRDAFHLLLVEGTSVRTSESHLGSVLQNCG